MYNENMNNGKNYIDYNLDSNRVIQWIRESERARWEYQGWLYRVNQAMLGHPSRNLYKEQLKTNLDKIPADDMSQEDRERCLNVPEGSSFILSKCLSNRANQMAGGVDGYEYQINDPYMLIDDDTEDLLAAKCEQDYVENRLELLSPTFSRDLDMAGVAAVLVKYNPKHDRNEILRINPKNIWFDTMYSATGNERFRGYSTMISWRELKKIIEAEKDEINLEFELPDRSIFNKNGKPDAHIKVGKKKIKTINDLDIYIEDMNKLAGSADLQGFPQNYFEYAHDLRSCYNLNWYRTLATDPEAKTKSHYAGDDVELTVIYDLDKHTEFKVINRRFVITANKKSFKRKIKFQISNPITNVITYRLDDFTLDCPLKFQFEEQENRDKFPYPTAQCWKLLDSFDELCSWRAKREHVTNVLSILRIVANAADTESLRRTINIMGIILDDIQGDVQSVALAYDYTPIDSQIRYLENMIREELNAYSQFDALQTMGDRATAAESGQAQIAVAQGLVTHQNAIMNMYADIARQSIANRVAYSPLQEFPVNNFGNYASVTAQQMALNAIVRVKPKLAKKIQERTLAANALAILGTMKDILPKQAISYLVTQALFGQVPRKLADSFMNEKGASEQEIANAQLQAQNQANMLAQNQAMYEQNPIPYEVDNVMANNSPEDIEAIITGLNTPNGGAPAYEQNQNESIDMMSQEGAMQTNLEGLTPESGSRYANPNSNGNF